MLYVPEVEEIRISPVVSRKGYLNILEHKTNGWKKRWVVNILSQFIIIHMSKSIRKQSIFKLILLLLLLTINIVN